MANRYTVVRTSTTPEKSREILLSFFCHFTWIGLPALIAGVVFENYLVEQQQKLPQFNSTETENRLHFVAEKGNAINENSFSCLGFDFYYCYHNFYYPSLILLLLIILIKDCLNYGKVTTITTEAVVTVYPIGVQISTTTKKRIAGKLVDGNINEEKQHLRQLTLIHNNDGNNHESRFVGCSSGTDNSNYSIVRSSTPLFIPKDEILDCIVNEVILLHKVISVVMFRTRKKKTSKNKNKCDAIPQSLDNNDYPRRKMIPSLLQKGEIELTPAFPGIEDMSYMDCLKMRNEISKRLGLS